MARIPPATNRRLGPFVLLLLLLGSPIRAQPPEGRDLEAPLTIRDLQTVSGMGWIRHLEYLGYVLREDGSIYFPSEPGQPLRRVPKGHVFGLYSDAQSLDPNLKFQLQSSGAYSIDHPTGRLLLNLGGGKNRPLSPLEVEAMLHATSVAGRHAALEKLHVHCSCPLDDDRRTAIDHLTRLEHDGLPQDLVNAIRASRTARNASLVAGALPQPLNLLAYAAGPLADEVLRRKAEAAYNDSSRAQDRARSLAELSRAAAPLQPLDPAAPLPSQHFDALEEKLAEAFQPDVQSVLAQNPVGARILADLGGRLPSLSVIRIGPSKNGAVASIGATYSPTGRRMNLPQDALGADLRDHAVKELGIDAGVADGWLADNRLMVEFLSITDPADRRAEAAARLRRWIVERMDVHLAHELTHALQDRREKAYQEHLRGNISGLPLENELEAMRVENEYFKEKVAAALAQGADPSVLRRNSLLGFYIQFLSDPNSWREEIARIYGTSAHSQDLETLSGVQKARRDQARLRVEEARGSPEKLPVEIQRQNLALAALDHGDAAVNELKLGYNEREGAFFRDRYPALRLEGVRDMGRIHLKSDPYTAFAWFRLASNIAPQAERIASEKELADAAHRAIERLESPPPGRTAEESFLIAKDLFHWSASDLRPASRYVHAKALANAFKAADRPDYRFRALSDAQRAASYMEDRHDDSRSLMKTPWIKTADEATQELHRAADALRDGLWLEKNRPSAQELFELTTSIQRIYASKRGPAPPRWFLDSASGQAQAFLDLALSHFPGSGMRKEYLASARTFLDYAPEKDREALKKALQEAQDEPSGTKVQGTILLKSAEAPGK